MFQTLLSYFNKSAKAIEYTPVKHDFIRDPEIAEQLNKTGYYIVDFLPDKERLSLTALYEMHYKGKKDKKGAFLDVMSQNINDSINEILVNAFDKWLINYKNIASTFVVKTPGESGQVPIHQDAATTDESKYSTINIWIPLQAVDATNGALHIVPRSHRIFIPYRSSTIEPYIKNVESLLYPYFIPLQLKLGQAVFFDSRMFHYSPPNLSDQNRAAAICRIFPKEADFIVFFKDSTVPDKKIEMWKCPDDYLIHNDYSHNIPIRPKGCELVGYQYADTSPLTEKQFEKIRRKLGILPQS